MMSSPVGESVAKKVGSSIVVDMRVAPMFSHERIQVPNLKAVFGGWGLPYIGLIYSLHRF